VTGHDRRNLIAQLAGLAEETLATTVVTAVLAGDGALGRVNGQGLRAKLDALLGQRAHPVPGVCALAASQHEVLGNAAFHGHLAGDARPRLFGALDIPALVAWLHARQRPRKGVEEINSRST
jgi:hypothetical protein